MQNSELPLYFYINLCLTFNLIIIAIGQSLINCLGVIWSREGFVRITEPENITDILTVLLFHWPGLKTNLNIVVFLPLSTFL